MDGAEERLQLHAFDGVAQAAKAVRECLLQYFVQMSIAGIACRET
jgi:hypothetical protein